MVKKVQMNTKRILKKGKQDPDTESESSEEELESSESESEEERVITRRRKNSKNNRKKIVVSEDEDEEEEEEESDSSYRPSDENDSDEDEDDEEDDEEDEDEEDDDEEDDEDEEDEDDEEEDEFSKKDMKKYRKFISKLFPSKYSKRRAQIDSDSDEEDSSDASSKKKSKKITKKNNKNKNKKKTAAISPKSSSSSDSSSSSSTDVTETTESSVSKKKTKKSTKKSKDKKKAKDSKKKSSKSDKKKSKKDESESDSDSDSSSDSDSESISEEDQQINIILSLDANQEEYDNYFADEFAEEEDDEDEECDSDDEQKFMKEKYEKIDIPRTKSELKKIEKAQKKKERKQKEKEDDDAASVKVESEYTELLELKKDLSKKLEKNPKSKILIKALKSCVESIKDLVKNARTKNVREYRKLVSGGEKKPNEMTYFKKQLSNAEQLRVMNDLKEINSFINIDKPYRLALLESKMPAKFKAHAFQKLNQLNMMDSCDPEYYKIKNWVDNFMRIPFCTNKSLSVNLENGIDACHEFMADAKKQLDDCVYGLDDAKLQIMQMIGQWITNPEAMGTSIAIKGPPGTGKTTLVKDGISKILGREFVFIPLGGTGDASYLEGHSYTYEGSTWGKIVQSLMNCGSMNPVFFFDELDKLSETPKGEEVTGILTHLTDTTQNSQFHDKYFSEIDFDLSKALFIFSYNDESKVNPILKDRMYRIQTKGYETKEKIVIAREHLLPTIREQVSFTPEEVIIPDDTLQYIITSEKLSQGESGVRNLKRCLEIIHTKLNLFRLMKPEVNLFEKEMKMDVKFPFTVTRKDVDMFIKNEESNKSVLYSMYV